MSSTSPFDPTTFAQMTFNEANSTVSTPIPAGEWPFEVTKVDIQSWSNKEKTNFGLKCVLMLDIQDDAVRAITGRPKNLVRYEMMLDLTPEGGLDFGKGMNVKLGRAREALGLNKPGQPFAFDMFLGRTGKAKVSHEEYQGTLQARCDGIVTG